MLTKKQNKYYATGVDIGVKGAIVTVDETGSLVGFTNLKTKKEELYKKKKYTLTSVIQVESVQDAFKHLPRKDHIIGIETPLLNHASRGSGQAQITIGYNYALIRETIKHMGIPFIMIAPYEWMKPMMNKNFKKESSILLTKGIMKKKDINKITQDSKINDGIADAFLIAIYALQYAGVLKDGYRL